MKASTYEIRYESSTFSGTAMIPAYSPEEALAKFREEWAEHGDEAPSAWVAGCWAMTF